MTLEQWQLMGTGEFVRRVTALFRYLDFTVEPPMDLDDGIDCTLTCASWVIVGPATPQRPVRVAVVIRQYVPFDAPAVARAALAAQRYDHLLLIALPDLAPAALAYCQRMPLFLWAITGADLLAMLNAMEANA